MWPIFHGPETLSYISKTIWCMSVIFSDNETVWPKLWPQSKYKSTWPTFHGLVNFAYCLQDYLMDEHHSWYNGSVWHIHWPYQVYVGQWPIFYGPAILLHILKTIWWRNVVLGIMDHCDSKIDLVKYMWVSDLYFMVHWFYLISLSDLNYFYTLRNGTGRGYLCPSGHLLQLIYEGHTWDYGSVWHKNLLHKKYVGHRPLFHGPVIFLDIFMITWWINVNLG